LKIRLIEYEEFMKLDIRVGLIKSCENIPKSNNLYKLQVDCGEKKLRQIITGISQFYKKEDLLGIKIVLLVNLKPKIIMAELSEGMLLAADFKGEPYLLTVIERNGKTIPLGSKIK
jgi:methionine--tRNA ligase beta chain